MPEYYRFFYHFTKTTLNNFNKLRKKVEKVEKKKLYERLSNGEPVNMLDPDYSVAIDDMEITRRLSFAINNVFHENVFQNTNKIRPLFGELIGAPVADSTTIMPPFHIDFGKNIKLGKQVFINHNCTCMSAGGIIIDDNVQIGPQVTLTTTNHDFDNRYILICKSIHIKKNVWIGAGALVLPGVTIGENSVIAGGAVVTKDVEPNVVVGGNPAKVLKRLDE
jgi:acetyltransferase-like isoleucine patch superfamily enzyme